MLDTVFADPNLAFSLLILGALGVYWELHAPGMIVPGLLGLLLIATGAYGIYQDSPSWYGITLLAAALLLLAIELKYYTHMISGIAGAILLAFGAVFLLEGGKRITPALAASVSLAFGAITIFLGFLGMRARQTRHLTGLETMVGTVGVCKTDIDPEGTIFVNGEYWKARSSKPLTIGQRVVVENIQDLQLFVKEA
ncbi:MAG: NfeD family protein [Bryobacteraceae bacterium]